MSANSEYLDDGPQSTGSKKGKIMFSLSSVILLYLTIPVSY